MEVEPAIDQTNETFESASPTQSKEPSQVSLYRVKVYKLDIEGQWHDQGTGNVACDYIQEKSTIALSVTEEPSNASLLLNVFIVKDDIYERQQETLIVWAYDLDLIK
jgi:hypothetical protein